MSSTANAHTMTLDTRAAAEILLAMHYDAKQMYGGTSSYDRPTIFNTNARVEPNGRGRMDDIHTGPSSIISFTSISSSSARTPATSPHARMDPITQPRSRTVPKGCSTCPMCRSPKLAYASPESLAAHMEKVHRVNSSHELR